MGVMTASLDGEITVQRVGELVRHTDAHSCHKQEGAVGDGSGGVDRSRVLKRADGEVVAESALHAVEVHDRRQGDQWNAGWSECVTDAREPVVVAALVSEAELTGDGRAT